MSNNTFLIDQEHVSCLTTEQRSIECTVMRHEGSKFNQSSILTAKQNTYSL
jgi:hypothetical protein